MKLKVMSYNIHKGRAITGRSTLENIREGIRLAKAELVFLQEVRGEKNQNALATQFEFLADAAWPHYAYGKNAVYPDGHHGNAILSSYPVIRHCNTDVSTNRFEKRGLLHAVVQNPNLQNELDVICLHLNLLPSSRRLQIKRLSEYVKEKVPQNKPLIVAGDFNDWSGFASDYLNHECKLIDTVTYATGRPAKTYPSWLPILSLDRIYVRGLKVKSAAVIDGGSWSSLSDHLALMTELEWT